MLAKMGYLKMVNEIKSVSDLIDVDMDKFKLFISRTPNLTMLYSIKNMLATEYSKVEAVKNELLTVLKNEKNKVQQEKIKKSIDDLYRVLIVIETKCMAIEAEKIVRGA